MSKKTIKKSMANIDKWCSDDSNVSRFCEKPRIFIAAYSDPLSTIKKSPGLLARRLDNYSFFHYHKFCLSSLSKPEYSHLEKAVSAHFYSVKVDFKYSLAKKRAYRLSLNNTGFLLGNLLWLGLLNEASELVDIIHSDQRAEIFIDLEWSSSSSLFTNLFLANLKKTLKPEEGCNYPHLEKLAASIHSEDSALAIRNFEKLWLWHIERSNEDNNKEYFEFSYYHQMLIPVAPLAFASLCKSLKLFPSLQSSSVIDLPFFPDFKMDRLREDESIDQAVKIALKQCEEMKQNSFKENL